MKLFQAVAFSILLHLVLLLGMEVYGLKFNLVKKEKVQWVEYKQPEEKDHVFMAEETKRVEKQTRTRETSPTQITAPSENTHAALMPPKETVQPDGGDLGRKLRSFNATDNDIILNQGNVASPSASPAFRQRLQSFLPPDLEIGDVVALNTDQNTFYTFYRRMAEKVVWPWAQNVISGFEKMRAQGQLAGASRAWVTVIEVILDDKGRVVSTQPLQLAGDFEIDNAPVRAFKQAKTFPNPPAEMVEEDGYIRIRYKFVVYYRPQP